jgi:hypothetical protein
MRCVSSDEPFLSGEKVKRERVVKEEITRQTD